MHRRYARALVSMLLLMAVFFQTPLAVGKSSTFASKIDSRTARVSQLVIKNTVDLPGTFSGLVWDHGDVYWTLTDGGPATADWPIRLVKLKVNAREAVVTDVIPIVDESGQAVTGDKLDPEDIVLSPDGTLWIVDEIYPAILQVSQEGRILQRVQPPEKYKARVKGRGFEGVALSPDGRTLFAILQTGLSTEPDKSHTWLLAYDMQTGTFKEYAYYLDKPSNYVYPQGVSAWIGASGLSAVSSSELLVIERDNLSGDNARVKRVYRVVVPDEPSGAPLAKELVVDLYALGYRLEKSEGLCLCNANTLMIINDNDGNLATPTVLWRLQF